MSTLRNPIIFAIILAIACALELIVIDEEVLLMICFASFFFNAFVNFGQQVKDSIESRANSIKAQSLMIRESKNVEILKNIEQIDASNLKTLLFLMAEKLLNKALWTTIYSEIIPLFQKCNADSSQIVYQRYLTRKNLEEASVLRTLLVSAENTSSDQSKNKSPARKKKIKS